MGSLVEEYRNQQVWRGWESYLDKLPLDPQHTVLDMGCGTGMVTKMLAQKVSQVFGIDKHEELISEAKRTNHARNIRYLRFDLLSSDYRVLPRCQGIWSSFAASYIPEFTPVLQKWCRLLQPGGWIALVEMSDLFLHEPLSESTRELFEAYCLRQSKNHLYDFSMGKKLSYFVSQEGLSIMHEENRSDPELTFQGPADPGVLKSWEQRLERMQQFRDYLGESRFRAVKDEFLICLSAPDHRSHAQVNFLIARK